MTAGRLTKTEYYQIYAEDDVGAGTVISFFNVSTTALSQEFRTPQALPASEMILM
jgi:hypothetical protein